MATDQLLLFNQKKYTGVQPPHFKIEPPTSEATILKTLPAYHLYLDSGQYSKYTPDDFTSDLKNFGLFVKGKQLQEIRTIDIQQWIAAIKKTMTAKTVSRKISAITNYFKWLEVENILEENPAQSIRYMRVSSPLPDILFENECQNLLTAASSDVRSYFLVLLLLETGLKKEELFELKTTHFDMSNKYRAELWVKHTDKKVYKDRKVPLPAEIVPVYEDYITQYNITDLVFPYTPRFIEMVLTDVAKNAGIRKKVTAGILRDTHVVRRLKTGANIDDILSSIGLSSTTWDDAKTKYLKLVR